MLRRTVLVLGTIVLRFAVQPNRSDFWCARIGPRIPYVFACHTFLVEFAERPPLSVFRPNPGECHACDWFPATRLPHAVHWGVRWSVRRLGLLSLGVTWKVVGHFFTAALMCFVPLTGVASENRVLLEV